MTLEECAEKSFVNWRGRLCRSEKKNHIELYSECRKGENEMTREEKAKVIYAHLTNAYRDQEEWIEAGARLTLMKGGDLTEELSAMLLAMISFADRASGGLPEEYRDLVGFTHLLNRVAIQASEFE